MHSYWLLPTDYRLLTRLWRERMATTEQTATPLAANAVRTRRWGSTQARADARLGIALVAPAVITIIVIAFYPLLRSIWDSMHKTQPALREPAAPADLAPELHGHPPGRALAQRALGNRARRLRLGRRRTRARHDHRAAAQPRLPRARDRARLDPRAVGDHDRRLGADLGMDLRRALRRLQRHPDAAPHHRQADHLPRPTEYHDLGDDRRGNLEDDALHGAPPDGRDATDPRRSLRGGGD